MFALLNSIETVQLTSSGFESGFGWHGVMSGVLLWRNVSHEDGKLNYFDTSRRSIRLYKKVIEINF
jgi:hypothetical protein